MERTLAVLLMLVMLGGGVAGVNPGIKVTLNTEFFKKAITDLIGYMDSLKQNNTICVDPVTQSKRNFTNTTPLFTIKANCENFVFQQLTMNDATSGVQFLDSAKAIKLVFYEFKTNFTFDYRMWTEPYDILSQEEGRVEASFNKINLIVKLNFDLDPNYLFGLKVDVSSVLIYNAKANQSLKITSAEGPWSQ